MKFLPLPALLSTPSLKYLSVSIRFSDKVGEGNWIVVDRFFRHKFNFLSQAELFPSTQGWPETEWFKGRAGPKQLMGFHQQIARDRFRLPHEITWRGEEAKKRLEAMANRRKWN